MPDSQSFHLQEEHYSVDLTVHLPDFSIEVVEAFMESLDQGLTVVRTKDFPKLHDLHQMLAIKESGGSNFPSIYGAEKEAKRNDENGKTCKAVEVEGQKEVQDTDNDSGEKSSHENLEEVEVEEKEKDDEGGAVESNYIISQPEEDQQGDNREEHLQAVFSRSPSPTSDAVDIDSITDLLGDDQESDFEMSSHSGEDLPIEDIEVETDDLVRGESFLQDASVPSSPEKKPAKPRPYIKLIKRTIDAAFPPNTENSEQKVSVESSQRILTRSKSRETLESDHPLESLVEGESIEEEITTETSAGPSEPKRRRKSCSTPRMQVDEAEDAAEEEFSCPVKNCEATVRSDQKYDRIYYFLRHVIQEHLKNSPCKLYDSAQIKDPKEKTRYICQYCDKSSQSSTSIFSHMALQHDDLHKRIQDRLKGSEERKKSRSILIKINKFLNSNWDCWTDCQAENEKILSKQSQSQSLQKSKSGKEPQLFEPQLLVITTEGNQSDSTGTSKVDPTVPRKKTKELVKTPKTNQTLGPAKDSENNRSDDVNTSNSQDTLEEKRDDENNPEVKHTKDLEFPPTESIGGESSQAPSEIEEDDVDPASVTTTCKYCDYLYTDDNDLRNHLLMSHRKLFHNIPLLEAGEKYYECKLNCNKSYRTKDKILLAKHLYEAHENISVQLIEKENCWGGKLLNYKNFCFINNIIKDQFDREPQLPTSFFDTLTQVMNKPKSHQAAQIPPDLRSQNNNVKSSFNMSSPEEPMNQEEDADDDEIIVECVFPSKKAKNVVREKPDDFMCKVCDLDYQKDGLAVSKHVFFSHLQHTSMPDVWNSLYSHQEHSQFVCDKCHTPRTFQQELRAKIHVYNHHKRELKKAMDDNKVEWRNLLDFIRFDIPENEPLEEEEEEEVEILTDSPPSQASQVSQEVTVTDADEVQETPAPSLQLPCPYLGCSQNFSLKTELLQHYLSLHRGSPWTLEVLEILSDEKYDPADTASLPSGTSRVRRCQICPASLEESLYSDHCSLHQDPRELTQCPHCLRFFLSQSEVESHQCPQYQERERIQRLASHVQGGLPCNHGCGEKFSDKGSLHSHAKTCSRRPANSFLCSVKGCRRKFYYTEDFEKHVKKHGENIRNIEN